MLHYFFDTLQMRAVRRARRRGVSTLQYSGRLGSDSLHVNSAIAYICRTLEMAGYANMKCLYNSVIRLH